MPELRDLEEVVGPVSRETYTKLQTFAAEFLRWNSRINLVAASTSGDLWRRHILDSAQLVKLTADAASWVDLGTGGGFPGAIVAILLEGRCTVQMVESNRKKAAFLRTTLSRLAPGSVVHAVRIEDAAPKVGPADIVSARALASLPMLLAYAEPWTSQGARCLFQKGRDYRRELEESRDGWEYDLVEHRSVTEQGSIVLEFCNVRRKPLAS